MRYMALAVAYPRDTFGNVLFGTERTETVANDRFRDGIVTIGCMPAARL